MTVLRTGHSSVAEQIYKVPIQPAPVPNILRFRLHRVLCLVKGLAERIQPNGSRRFPTSQCRRDRLMFANAIEPSFHGRRPSKSRRSYVPLEICLAVVQRTYKLGQVAHGSVVGSRGVCQSEAG